MLTINSGRIVIALPRKVRLIDVARLTIAAIIGISWLLLCVWVLSGAYRLQQQQEQAYGQDRVGTTEQHPPGSSTSPASAPQQGSPREETNTRYETVDWPNVSIAALTLGLLFVTGLQYLTLADTLAANKAIERAYISISHNPPGVLLLGQVENGIQRLSVNVGVTNQGNTPARVLTIEMFAHTSTRPLPELPPHGTPADEPSSAYLVKNEQFFVSVDFWYPEGVWLEITTNQRRLWIFGYVDYLDSFGKRHRAGYARKYVHGNANNLSLEPKASYNYDIEIDQDGNPKK